MSIFQNAIESINDSNHEFYGPKSFLDYLSENNLSEKSTAQHISVDSYEKLNGTLRENKLMVLRLGSQPDSRGTSFILTKTQNNWNDFFIFDRDLIADKDPSIFIPETSQRELYPFQLLPKLTETSMVNLAIGSGLLSRALEIDEYSSSTMFATGQSTFTFEFQLRENSQQKLHHVNGQIEIDGLFLGRKNNNEKLILVEAKHGVNQGQSLAKHKLFYPYKALESSIPDYFSIMPVYIKSWEENKVLHFLITECEVTNSDVLTSLKPKKSTYFAVANLR